jgi:hypothetical protein
MSAGDIPYIHSGDQFEHQGRVQLRRTLVRALRWCAADTPVADYAPLNPTDRRALRRLYRLVSLRQPRGSMLATAALDMWRGVVVESKGYAETIEQGRELRQKAFMGHFLREWAHHPAFRARRLSLTTAMTSRRWQRYIRRALLYWCLEARASQSVQQRALQMETALSKVTEAKYFAGWAEWQAQHASGAVSPCKARALVPPAQGHPPQSTPKTPVSASCKVVECGDHLSAAGGVLSTYSRTATSLVRLKIRHLPSSPPNGRCFDCSCWHWQLTQLPRPLPFSTLTRSLAIYPSACNTFTGGQ